MSARRARYVAPIYGYLVSDLAKDVTGRIFIAAGGFIGEFARPETGFIGYRDHKDTPPYAIGDVQRLIGG